jgi:glucosyl-dolichyl phosphate glucuronosyltransferase
MASVHDAHTAGSAKANDVTVAICTYKRPLMLRGVLDTLEHQELNDDVTWEVLVIDNDPDASAKSVFESCSSRSPLRLRYIHEQKPGLSHARNRAILESQGGILAFLDDDVLVPRRWLVKLLSTFERTGADCVGGRVLVKWDGHPEDVVRGCEKQLVAFDRGGNDVRLVGRDVPIGANLALKANVLRDQAFVPGLGRTRTNLMGCEEIEFLLRLRKQGRSIWYSAASVVMHRTGGERLTGAYYKRREYWNGISLAAVDKLQNDWAYCQIKAWARLAQVIVALLPAWLWALVTGNTRAQFLNTCYRTKYIGYWRGIVGFAGKPQ